MGELKSSSQIVFCDGIAYNNNPADWIDRSKIMIPLDELLGVKADIEKRADSCFEGQFQHGLCEALDVIECHLGEIYDRLGIKNPND